MVYHYQVSIMKIIDGVTLFDIVDYDSDEPLFFHSHAMKIRHHLKQIIKADELYVIGFI